MNEDNRRSVEYYIKSCFMAPLIFEGYVSNQEEFDPTKYSVEDMVERTLELCKTHVSVNSHGYIETSRNKSRSSLDIWRHIRYYYPDVTIFDVMHAIYNMGTNDLGDKNIGGLYCSDVRRRVFRLLRLEDYGDYGRNFDYSGDEYGLDFCDWKDI